VWGFVIKKIILRIVAKKNIYLVFILAIAIFIFESCSSSSPRFKGRDNANSSSRSTPKHGPRFSSKEVEEEIKENDKKPDSIEIKSITNGSRDFRKEKNTAIHPLDQSRMMREISKYMGVSYVSGGASMEGMDCSGYTMTVYKNAIGKKLPRTSLEQSNYGEPVKLSELKFGDLIFFNTTGERASHVGIYLGDDLFAHASVSLGVTISSLQSSYYADRYEFARRIVAD
jgi:cell wall-associated NlpC family hydrolase